MKYYKLKKKMMTWEAGSVFTEEEIPEVLLYSSHGGEYSRLVSDTLWEEIDEEECENAGYIQRYNEYYDKMCSGFIKNGTPTIYEKKEMFDYLKYRFKEMDDHKKEPQEEIHIGEDTKKTPYFCCGTGVPHASHDKNITCEEILDKDYSPRLLQEECHHKDAIDAVENLKDKGFKISNTTQLTCNKCKQRSTVKKLQEDDIKLEFDKDNKETGCIFPELGNKEDDIDMEEIEENISVDLSVGVESPYNHPIKLDGITVRGACILIREIYDVLPEQVKAFLILKELHRRLVGDWEPDWEEECELWLCAYHRFGKLSALMIPSHFERSHLFYFPDKATALRFIDLGEGYLRIFYNIN